MSEAKPFQPANQDAYARLTRALIDVKRIDAKTEDLGSKRAMLEKQIPDLAKWAGVPDAELKRLRAQADLEAQRFGEVRREAARKAVETRRANLGQAPASPIVAAKPQAPQAAPVKKSAQADLLTVPATPVQSGGKKVENKAAKQSRLKK